MSCLQAATGRRGVIALSAMLAATAASAHVQNGDFATNLDHWEEHGYRRAVMGTAANPKIPKNFADLGLTQQDTGTFISKEPLHKSPTHVLAHACRVQQHPGLCSNLILA